MFLNLLRMDLKRSLDIRRLIPVPLLFVFFMVIGDESFVINPGLLLPGNRCDESILAKISLMLSSDTFKTVFVVLFCSVYCASFCREKSNGYIRMLLARVDAASYTQSKFIANTLATIVISTCSFGLYALILLPNYHLGIWDDSSYHYSEVARGCPVGYLLMISLQFAMVAAAFGSMGMLASAFQPAVFVGVGLPGLLFFLLVSFGSRKVVFGVSQILSMDETLSFYTGCPKWVDYLWGLTLPFLVICLCGYLFYRRLVRRMKEGDV